MDKFLKGKAVLSRFGGAFKPASYAEHYDLAPGTTSKTQLPGEIKYTRLDDTPESGKAQKGLHYPGGDDFTLSEHKLAKSGQVHQFLVLFDQAAYDDVKWPIFVTDTPKQRANWASRVTDAETCGTFSVGGVNGGPFGTVEAVTQWLQHEKFASVWGYIVGPKATAEPPPLRHPYKCTFCSKPAFTSFVGLANHGRYCTGES